MGMEERKETSFKRQDITFHSAVVIWRKTGLALKIEGRTSKP